MPEQRDSVTEIERLIDELESFAEKSPWYLPNKVAIRDEDFFRITQRIRELMPSELSEARQMLDQRDAILRNAQEEHRRIIESAEKRLEDLTSEERVVIVARQEAERIIAKARQDAGQLQSDALRYTADLLADMEKEFSQTLQQIRKGREFLSQQLGPVAAPAEASAPAAPAESSPGS